MIINTLACKIAIKAIVIRPIADTPEASPSKPSIKLIALVIATIQIMVIGILNIPK